MKDVFLCSSDPLYRHMEIKDLKILLKDLWKWRIWIYFVIYYRSFRSFLDPLILHFRMPCSVSITELSGVTISKWSESLIMRFRVCSPYLVQNETIFIHHSFGFSSYCLQHEMVLGKWLRLVKHPGFINLKENVAQ